MFNPKQPVPVTPSKPLASNASASGFIPTQSRKNLFAWPKPPFNIYGEEPVWTDVQACEIAGLNGGVQHCFLMGIEELEKTLWIQISLHKPPFSLNFSQFCKLALKAPIKPLDEPQGKALTDELDDRYYSEYEIELKSGETLSGRSVGCVETNFGLFLFPPIDMLGTVKRVFVPNEAYSASRIEANLPDFFGQQAPGSDIAPHTLPQATPKVPLITTVDHLLLALEKEPQKLTIRLGEALMQLGYIDENQLHQALAFRHTNDLTPLGQMLVTLGFLTRKQLNTTLAHKMGYPMVDVTLFPVELESLHKVSMAVAQRLMVLPLVLRPNLLVVAAADPSMHGMIEELEFLSQVHTVAVLGDSLRIMAAISSAYQKISINDLEIGDNDRLKNNNLIDFSSVSKRDNVANQVQQILRLQDYEPFLRESAPDPENCEADIKESDHKLVRLVNTMIIEAHARGVSDIHVECRPDKANIHIRFRIDGLLAPYLELPHTYRNALVARLKIMANLALFDRHKPQDGKIEFQKFYPGHHITLQVATIPTAHDFEDVVLHLLSSAKLLARDNLGLTESNLAHLREAISRRCGMVLCVGPTGSGKTTTLHSVLRYLSTPGRTIWTVEDPIKIKQPDLRQVQINPSIEWTFAKLLRSFLRADPDIILVSELRDQETARIAVEASRTGRLVLSTLQTNSAVETLNHLIDMGINSISMANSLLMVLAQRLVRSLCSQCKVSVEASANVVDALLDDYLLAFPAEHQPDRAATLAQWRANYGQDNQLQQYRAYGCHHCQGSGFSGRMGLHELLCITPALRSLIQTSASADLIQIEAFKSGDFRTLHQDGIIKVLRGLTTLEEVRANCHA